MLEEVLSKFAIYDNVIAQLQSKSGGSLFLNETGDVILEGNYFNNGFVSKSDDHLSPSIEDCVEFV